MREYLFRGKKTSNGEWVYGDLWCNLYVGRRVFIVSPINIQDTIGGNEVNPETVGQYTGYKDKNGKKIFEGDIVAFNYVAGDFTNCNCEILWFKNKWVVRERNHYLIDDLDLFFCRRSTVIGNIYDNLELLGDENNEKRDNS